MFFLFWETNKDNPEILAEIIKHKDIIFSLSKENRKNYFSNWLHNNIVKIEMRDLEKFNDDEIKSIFNKNPKLLTRVYSDNNLEKKYSHIAENMLIKNFKELLPYFSMNIIHNLSKKEHIINLVLPELKEIITSINHVNFSDITQKAIIFGEKIPETQNLLKQNIFYNIKFRNI